MTPRPRIMVPAPVVERLPDQRFRAFTAGFPGLDTVDRTAAGADFRLRLMVQKRLFGQRWSWDTAVRDQLPAHQAAPGA